MASPSGTGGEPEDVEIGPSRTRSSSSKSSGSNGLLAVQDPFTAAGAAGKSRREDEEEALAWASWEKLPSYDRLQTTVLEKNTSKGGKTYDQTDVRNDDPAVNKAFLDKLFQKGVEVDNEDFLVKIRKRLDR
jgi:hypothetical protein